MKSKFKFFRGYNGTLDLMDGQTYATASFYDPRTLTEDERLTRINERIIRAEDFDGRIRISHEQYLLNRDMLIEQERIRRLGMINHSRETDNQIRLFQSTTVITVNPTPWTKVKIFGTKVKLVLTETWRVEPIGVVVMSILLTLVTIIGIAKLFGA
jgi:hypothetical protein